MLLSLGNIKSDFAGFSKLAGLHTQLNGCFLEKICFDFQNASEFELPMCAPFGVLLTHAYDGLNEVTVKNLQPPVAAVFSAAGFLEEHRSGTAPPTKKATFPYARFKAEDVRSFVEYLTKGVPPRSKVSQRLRRLFEDSILELFTNAAHHSSTEFGISTSGSFDSKTGQLRFSIADAGIGFQNRIREKLKRDFPPDEAIFWAMQKGNTTRMGSIPGGLGLDILQNLIKETQGTLQIASHSGYLRLSPHEHLRKLLPAAFPGTVFNLAVNIAADKHDALL